MDILLAFAADCAAKVYSTAPGNSTATHSIAVTGGSKSTFVLVGFTDGSFGPGLYVLNATL